MSKPATKFGSFFQTINVVDGSTRVTFTDAIPDWLKEACRGAMQNDMTDWLYVECEAACDAFDEGNLTDEDSISQYADGRVDVYTRELFQWAANHCLTDTFSEAQERAKELGGAGEASIEDRLKVVQYCAIEYIAQTILAAIIEETDDADLDADEN